MSAQPQPSPGVELISLATGDVPLLHHVAGHEAAHAVVGLLHGRLLESVTIVPAGDYLGCCKWDAKFEPEPETSADVARYTVAVLRSACAGAFGELAFGIVPLDKISFWGVESDAHNLREAVKSLRSHFTAPRVDSAIDRAFGDTYNYMVSTPGVVEAVRRVSLALLVRKTLDDAGVRAAILGGDR